MHQLRILIGVALFAFLATAMFGQTDSARLEGTIHDPTGAVVPNAKVTLVNVATQSHVEGISDAAGAFIFASVLPGKYNLTVEASGFRKSDVNGIELNVGSVVSQPVKLEVGQTSDSVVVEATTVNVQTTDSQVSRTITMRDIDTLPQLGRSPISLAAFQPGVQINPGDSTFSHINGNRGGSNNATLDGIDVNDSLVPRLGLSLTANNTDSIGEFRIVTTAAKAEYGRSAGGQVELITRSGTNSYHGNVFDYLRNTDLNANDFFNNQSGGAVPKFIQNQYGASAGGPIKHNKLFFFANWQGLRATTEQVRNRTVLSDLAKQGIFQWKDASGNIQQYNIVANDPRHIGIDPTVLKNSISLLPKANNSDLGDGLNTLGFRFNNPTGSRSDQATGKLDYQMFSNLHLFARWSDFHTSSTDQLNNADSTFPGQPTGTQGGHRWGDSIGLDWNATPRSVNEFRYGYQSASVAFNRPGRPAGPAYISNDYTDPYNSAFAQGRNSPVTEFTDNFTHILGKHTLKAGANYRHTLQTGYNDQGIYPNVTFSPTANGNAPPASVRPAGLSSTDQTRFNNLYNELLGRADQSIETFLSNLKTFQAAGTTRQRDYTLNEQGYFIQDDWRVLRNLTFNLGLRWDIFGSPHEKNGQQGTLDQIGALTAGSHINNFTVVPTSSFYPTDLNNFAPRFGFAWDIFGDGKTALRGNYGIFYDRTVGATVNTVDSGTPGFTQTAFVRPNVNGTDIRLSDNIGSPVVTGSPTLLLPANRSTSVNVYDPHLRTGYVEQYGLSIQRELAKNTILEVGYVGERGKKLFYNENLNQSHIYGDFLNSFKELQVACPTSACTGPAPSSTNTLVRMFGTPSAAVTGVGGSTVLTQGQVGAAASTIDQTQFAKYANAGLSDYYLRNFPQYNNVFYGTNAGLSWYDSLQVSLRRNTGMLRAAINFTYSHTLDNTNQEGNGTSSPIDSFNLPLAKARGDFDRPLSLNSAVTFTPPIGRNKMVGGNMPKWVDTLIGGWDIGSLLVIQSAQPFTVTSGRATGPTSAVASYANYSGDRNAGFLQRRGDGVYFFTPAEVAQFSSSAGPVPFPGAGEFGNTARNSFRGPTFINLDASLIKRFKITENQSVQFRAEGYNVFNHAQFGTPSVNLATPSTFGKYSSTLNGARTLQMALRYDF
ncbi:MAG: TonB-dependent receptor [Acidobacteriota bacterium]|nr:TonB-dependent receptor [Acidobacteriota bacterium]